MKPMHILVHTDVFAKNPLKTASPYLRVEFTTLSPIEGHTPSIQTNNPTDLLNRIILNHGHIEYYPICLSHDDQSPLSIGVFTAIGYVYVILGKYKEAHGLRRLSSREHLKNEMVDEILKFNAYLARRVYVIDFDSGQAKHRIGNLFTQEQITKEINNFLKEMEWTL